jgi:flagellar motor protein MotB
MKLSNIFLLLMMTLFISCSSNSVQNEENSKTKIKDSINKQKAIDEQMAKGDRPDDEQPTPTPAEERKRLIERYDQIET